MATFPATTYREAVDLALDASNQLHRIINESATSTISTASGPVDSLRKALTDNFYFKTPIDWAEGLSETTFNQLRGFTDGFYYYAPTATGSNPIPMGATPVGDPNWVLTQFDTATAVADALVRAETAATNAKVSETNAANSAADASASEIASGMSATNAANSAAAALVSEQNSAASEASASNQAIIATNAKIAAETARDAAQLSAGVYDDTTAGLAATVSGEYFNVPSPNSNESLILYKNNSGVAQEVKRYPSVSAVDAAIPYSADIWDETNDTHTSEGITTGVTEVHKNMRRCLLLDDGTVNYYLDANDSNLKEDGTPSVLSGEDGQVMVEIQKCWVQAKYIQGGSSPIIKWSVSAEPKAGYVLHPAFTRGGTLKYSPELGMWYYINPTEELDYVYVGAYDASVFDASSGAYINGLNLDNNIARVSTVEDKLASVSGKYPMVGLSRPEFRSLASNRGANWENLDFWTHSLTQILFITEYHDLNTQLVLGDGNVSVSSGYPASSDNQSDSPHSVAGKSNSIGNGSGSVTSTARDTAWVSYRGIENWYGNCWKLVDGVNINDRVHYVSNTGRYTDNTSVSYTQLGVAAPEVNGYIRQVQANTLSFIPLSVSGGTSSIAFSDHYYQNTGWRALPVGGNAGVGVSAGGFAWNANASAADRNRSFGSRLVYKKKL